MHRLIAAAALLSTIPLAGNAYTAQNRLSVADIGSGVFEVVGRPGSGARDYWCGAGDFALSLGVRSNTRIYLVSGRQPSVSEPGKTAVRFTVVPETAGVTPINPQIILSVDVPGDNLSVASARQYCSLDVGRF